MAYLVTLHFIKVARDGRSLFGKLDNCSIFNRIDPGLKPCQEIVAMCLDLYFKGTSLRKITDHIRQFHDLDIHFTTINKWITKYMALISDYVETLAPETSELWHTDEMQMKTGNGQWGWLWNVMDAETRFLLSNLVTKSRETKDAREVFRGAKNQAKGKPRFVITDGLRAYQRAAKKEFYSNRKDNRTVHIRAAGLKARRYHNNPIERLHGTIREREKVMRGLDNEESAEVLMEGFKHYYNFIRPHMALDNETPAQRAGINLDLGQNKWKGLIEKAVEHRVKNSTN